MKNFIKTFAIILFAFAFITTKAQKSDDFSKRICKEWKFTAYEDDDQLIPPTPEHTGDKMIFSADNKIILVEKGITTTGSWRYDAKEKDIIVTVDTTPKKIYQLEVKKLTDTELVVEYEDEETDESIDMHFSAAAK